MMPVPFIREPVFFYFICKEMVIYEKGRHDHPA